MYTPILQTKKISSSSKTRVLLPCGSEDRIDSLPPPQRIRSLSADQIMRFTIHGARWYSSLNPWFYWGCHFDSTTPPSPSPFYSPAQKTPPPRPLPFLDVFLVHWFGNSLRNRDAIFIGGVVFCGGVCRFFLLLLSFVCCYRIAFLFFEIRLLDAYVAVGI